MQHTRARLGIVPLGIAALANVSRRCDIDFAEGGVGDAPRRGAILARWGDRSDDREVTIAREMRGDFGEPADVLSAVRGEKPRSPFSPARSVSPSSRIGEPPLPNSFRSSARASVDLPEPGNPVSQTTAPL